MFPDVISSSAQSPLIVSLFKTTQTLRMVLIKTINHILQVHNENLIVQNKNIKINYLVLDVRNNIHNKVNTLLTVLQG